MPVLIEAITVVIRRDAVDARLAGGWAALRELIPNKTFCTDGTLARVAFLDPSAVRQFVEQLEAGGLTFAPDGEAVDFAVVDQFHGPTRPCPWLHFDTVTAPDGTTIRHAQLVPPGADPLPVESLGEVAVYEGWSTRHTCELFLTMAPTPEDRDEVRAMGQKGALGA